MSHSFIHGYTVVECPKKGTPPISTARDRLESSVQNTEKLNVPLTVAIAAKNTDYIWRKTAVLTAVASLL